ncbi:chalcone isomerase family protein, partial [Thiolapillus sp.]
MRWLSMLLIGLLPALVAAKTLEGVDLPEQVPVEGRNLVLNGAGIREKFFFDIYVAALYLPARMSDAARILQT